VPTANPYSVGSTTFKPRSSLALAGAGCLVELTAEAFVLGLKVVDPSL
jgi:hypothetical protein